MVRGSLTIYSRYFLGFLWMVIQYFINSAGSTTVVFLTSFFFSNARKKRITHCRVQVALLESSFLLKGFGSVNNTRSILSRLSPRMGCKLCNQYINFTYM